MEHMFWTHQGKRHAPRVKTDLGENVALAASSDEPLAAKL